MPVTPAVWTPTFQANTVDTDLAGRNDQQAQSVISLANGNILVVWESNSNIGPGAPAGFDVIGQIFDPIGRKVGGEIRLNGIYYGDNEGRPSVVAEAGGGFTVVYQDAAGANDRSIRLESYSAAGALTFAGSAGNDASPGGTPNYLNPVIAGNLLTPAVRMVAYVIDNGGGAQDVAFRMWHPGTSSLGTEKVIFSGGAAASGGIESLAATALDNGSFAIAYSDADGVAVSDVEVQIFSGGAVKIASLGVSAPGGRNDGVSIAGLTNHTMVATWTTGPAGLKDVVGQIVDNAGNKVGGPIDIASGPGIQAGASVGSLTQGGFAAAWVEDGTKVFAQSFTSAGAKIGTPVLLATVPGGAEAVTVTGLIDGRFSVSWTANDGGDHDVFSVILDSRDTANSGTNAADNVIVGTVNADTIQDYGGNDTIYAGAGDDTVYGGPGSDVMDGGEGRDTISYSGSNFAVKINLSAGTGSGGYALGDTLISFEDADGSKFHDELTGTSGDNKLKGREGNDTLYGGAGNDTLEGGAGIDDLYGGAGADEHRAGGGTSRARYDDANYGDLVVSLANPALNTGAAAGDTYFGIQGVFTGEGNDQVTGNSLDNYLSTGGGNDTLDGGPGNDTLLGGAGDDLYRNVQAGDKVLEAAGQGIDTIETAESWSILFTPNIENVTLTGNLGVTATGNDGNNVLTGNIGNNQLYGGFGNDTLTGNGGVDTLYGGSGDDLYVTGPADSVIESAGNGYDTVMSDYNTQLGDNVEKLVLTGGSNTEGWGNAIANTIAGNGGNNKLYGYGGADTLKGGEGNDTLDGGAGADELRGGQGDDTYINPTGDTIIEGATGGNDTVKSNATFSLEAIANVENLTLAGAAGIDGTGNALKNLITGNSGANALDGKDGNDTLDGGGGNDTLTGGAGKDTFRFGPAGMGDDRITDFSAADDRFDLGGAAFTARQEAGGNTTLTYSGGSIVVAGVAGLSLAQWNALVVPAGGSAKAAAPLAADAPDTAVLHPVAQPAWDMALFHHADFAFA